MLPNRKQILNMLSSPSNFDPEMYFFFFILFNGRLGNLFLEISKAHGVGNDALLPITAMHAQKPQITEKSYRFSKWCHRAWATLS